MILCFEKKPLWRKCFLQSCESLGGSWLAMGEEACIAWPGTYTNFMHYKCKNMLEHSRSIYPYCVVKFPYDMAELCVCGGALKVTTPLNQPFCTVSLDTKLISQLKKHKSALMSGVGCIPPPKFHFFCFRVIHFQSPAGELRPGAKTSPLTAFVLRESGLGSE